MTISDQGTSFDVFKCSSIHPLLILTGPESASLVGKQGFVGSAAGLVGTVGGMLGNAISWFGRHCRWSGSQIRNFAIFGRHMISPRRVQKL